MKLHGSISPQMDRVKLVSASALVLSLLVMISSAAPFKSIRDDYQKKSEIVSQLENVSVGDLNFVDVEISEALTYLQRAGSPDFPRVGVIAVTVVGGRAAPHENAQEDRLSLKLQKASFASAVDAICAELGWTWEIVLDGERKAPRLVIHKPKN